MRSLPSCGAGLATAAAGLAAGLLLGALAGCGSSLYTSTQTRHFRAKALCSQGPLELTLEASGARWGERIEVSAVGPRDLAGYYEVLVDGKPFRRGVWGKAKEIYVRVATPPTAPGAPGAAGGAQAGTASEPAREAATPSTEFNKAGEQPVAGPDNKRCLAAAPGPEPLSPAPPERPGSRPRATPPRQRGRAGQGAPSPVAASDRAEGVADSGLEKTEWAALAVKWPDTVFRFAIGEAFGTQRDTSSCYSSHLGPRNVLARGAKIAIRIWSSQPNDLEDVLFLVRHERSYASSDWDKDQRKQFRACLRKHPEQRKRWEVIEREKRRRDELAAKHGKSQPVALCVQYLPERLTDAQGRWYRASVTRPCFCFRVPKDETCWGAGGLAGFQKRLALKPPTEGTCYGERLATRWSMTKRLLVTKACRCFTHPDEEACWGKGGYAAYEQSEFDKAFAEPCERSVWIDTRVSRLGARRSAGRTLRGRTPPAPRRAAAGSPMPDRYLYEIRKPCPCFGKPKDIVCWGKAGYEGWLQGLRYSFPSEGNCTIHHRTPHPTMKSATWLLPVRKPCRCFGRESDEACWGKEGKPGFLKALVKRHTEWHLAAEKRRTSGTGPSAGALTEQERQQIEDGKRALEIQREHAEAERRLRQLRERETAAPRRRAPVTGEGPKLPPKPPPPRVEAPPDKPSTNAAWIPGYWHRGANAWHWIGGWWRVPPADVTGGLTAKADRPPPAPKPAVARPVAPAPEAVWVGGYWHWHRGRFVWIEGRWIIPPTTRHQWRPAGWRRVKGGAIFLPGGWIAPRQ